MITLYVQVRVFAVLVWNGFLVHGVDHSGDVRDRLGPGMGESDQVCVCVSVAYLVRLLSTLAVSALVGKVMELAGVGVG